LDAIIDAAAAVGTGGVVALDLDGCLFDNRHRQVQILRAWAERRGDVRLGGLRADHLQSWSLVETFGRLGLDRAEAQELSREVRPFWARWFFDDAYVSCDLPLPGAARFVRQLAETGARIAYLTGRGHRQRPSTLQALRRFGFPIDDHGDELWTKPDDDQGDEAWKIEGFGAITEHHALAAFLDNEPTHLRNAAHMFPEALIVWVDTDHSPRPVVAPAGSSSLHGYLRTADRVPYPE
jgi:phosphoglycolate phosphatase-like HAD superfamily hydrolase